MPVLVQPLFGCRGAPWVAPVSVQFSQPPAISETGWERTPSPA
jgi:hypothetical protein